MHIIRLSGKIYILRRTFNRMRRAFFTSLFSQFFSAWCCTCSRTEKKRLCLLLDFLSFIIFLFKKISMCTSNIICVLQTHALFYRCHVLILTPQEKYSCKPMYLNKHSLLQFLHPQNSNWSVVLILFFGGFGWVRDKISKQNQGHLSFTFLWVGEIICKASEAYIYSDAFLHL